MNTIKSAVLRGVCAAAVCLGASHQSNLFAADAAEAAPPETANNISTTLSGKLSFHVRGTSLETLLTYFSKEAGYIVYLRPGVTVTGTVDAWSEQPLSNDEAIKFLKTVLSDHGLSVLQDGKTLTIARTSDITTEAPIKLGADPDKIPRDAEVVTQIIPIRNLNPVELNRILQPLLPSSARSVVNESANSLLITDTQANIRRAAEIIAALDSVSASANTLKTYPLKYADAKEISGLIKELFAPADTGRAGGNGAFSAPAFATRRAGPGTRGAFGQNAAADNGTTPQSHVATTADEHGNVVIVSAPEALFADIDHLVSTLDVPIEDVTVTEVFHLNNADCTEMADQISQLFPDESNSGDASRTPFQFNNGQGNRGAQAVGARQGTTGSAGESSRMQKLGRVLAVPDPRTSSLLVSASESLMPSVRQIIERLDSIHGGRQQAFVIPVQYADLYELQQIILSLYPSANISTGSTATDPLEQRRNAIFNNMFSGSGAVAANNPASAFGRTSTGTTGRTGQ